MKNKIRLSEIIFIFGGAAFFLFTSCDKDEVTVTDIDGNVYSTIQIGGHTWMAENINTTRLRDGTAIPEVQGIDFSLMTTPAYCYHYDDLSQGGIYGALYNFYAVNTGKLCPVGWHVPTDEEWGALEIALGMSISDEAIPEGYRGTDEGSKLAGNSDLWADGTLKTNDEFGSSGFFALPGAAYSDAGDPQQKESAFFWTSTISEKIDFAYSRIITFDQTKIAKYRKSYRAGFSVRCVRNE